MNDINKEKQTNELMVNAIIKALKRADIPVIKASDDLAEILQLAGMQVAYKKKEAPETVSVSDKKHHQTVISSADGTKILKNLDNLARDYEEKLVSYPPPKRREHPVIATFTFPASFPRFKTRVFTLYS